MLPENLMFEPHEVSCEGTCFYCNYWDIWIKLKEEFEVVCKWTIRPCGKSLTDTGGVGTSSCPWPSDKALWNRDLQAWLRCCSSWWLWQQQLQPLSWRMLSALGTALTPHNALCTSGMSQVCDLPVVWISSNYSGSLRMKPVCFKSGVWEE